MSQGYWIKLDITPEELTVRGIPKDGDIVEIRYDENNQPWHGTAKVLASSVNTNRDMYRAPEYGESFVYAGIFAL